MNPQNTPAAAEQMAPNQTAATIVVTEPKKRNVRTRLFVHYTETDGREGLTPGFDSKLDLDAWLKQTNVTPVRITRGVEKKFSTKVSLA